MLNKTMLFMEKQVLVPLKEHLRHIELEKAVNRDYVIVIDEHCKSYRFYSKNDTIKDLYESNIKLNRKITDLNIEINSLKKRSLIQRILNK